MNTLQKGVVTLLRSAITGEALPLSADFCLTDAMDLIWQHGMTTLIYQGAIHCGIPQNAPGMDQLFQSYVKIMMSSEAQMRDCNRVMAAFDEAGIDYLPLKGCRMKALYPTPELRVMGDADILIRMEQYDKIRPIMESLGFQAGNETDHELPWTSKGLFLELHKRLIPSYNEDFCQYFGDGWSLAKIQSGTRYAMAPENEFIYLFTHFAKHFRDCGIGCRHLVDLWVFLRTVPALDEGFVRGELEKFYLGTFYDHIRRVMAVWFADGEPDEKTDLITDFLFDSGSRGLVDNSTMSSVMKRTKYATALGNRKLAYIWGSVFPTMNVMKREYPVLEQHPWLVPVVWPYRLVAKLMVPRKAWKGRGNALRLIGEDKLTQRQQFLNEVGLDYHF